MKNITAIARALAVLVGATLLTSCATRFEGSKMVHVSPGLAEEQVLRTLGKPQSVSGSHNISILHYAEYQGSYLFTYYYVRLVNGKVESYGTETKKHRVTETDPPLNGQDATRRLGAQANAAPNSPAHRVGVLSVLIGGMTAPEAFYRSFHIFLRDHLRSFTEGGGTIRTEYVSTGAHVFQLWSHAARVKAGKEDAFSNSTKRKCSRTMRTVVDPFLADNPGARFVLGGHSFGTIEMQCVKEMIEKKYGKQVIVAAYALAPAARKLDKDVAVVSARHDFMVALSDFLYPGRGVRGTAVTLPGLNHFVIQDSPDARKVLEEYFARVSSQLQDSTNRNE